MNLDDALRSGANGLMEQAAVELLLAMPTQPHTRLDILSRFICEILDEETSTELIAALVGWSRLGSALDGEPGTLPVATDDERERHLLLLACSLGSNRRVNLAAAVHDLDDASQEAVFAALRTAFGLCPSTPASLGMYYSREIPELTRVPVPVGVEGHSFTGRR